MMETYTYRMPWGETLRIRADLSQAAANIMVEGDDGVFCCTPYQTADARHREKDMLRLVVRHLGAEWYWDGTGDRDDALEAAVSGARDVEYPIPDDMLIANTCDACGQRHYDDDAECDGEEEGDV